jgi:O-glycosyl hydrolase
MINVRRIRVVAILAVGLGASSWRGWTQQAVALPSPVAVGAARAQSFSFVSDGPKGPGWSRPDEIARVYFADQLPALFARTVVLNGPVPRHGALRWIFTGPHAGFTVELTPSKVRVTQRYYDSTGLSSTGSFPERVVRDDEQQYTGEAKTLTVVLDSHLAVAVLVNGAEVLKQSCVFDVLRHQLEFAAPRTEHLVLSGALLASPTQDAIVQVNPAVRHQTMLGFGGSPSIPTYERMSEEGKREYWTLLKRYNLLIDREYPMGSELKQDLSNREDLRDATPHYYGDNFPNGEVSDFAYNKKAQELGGAVIYEMWALPPWATEAYDAGGKPILDAWNKAVRTAAKPEEYARIMVDYCRRARELTGSAPAILGVQNEVEQPPEVFAAMVTVLRRELDKAGFASVKIHMADASFMDVGTNRVRALERTPEAWAKVDFAAAHEYDFQEFMANPDLYDAKLRAMHEASAGKPFLATEICINNPQYQEPSYRIALNVAQLYQKNLTELDAEMLLYCWLLLDVEEPTFGGSRALLVPNKTDGYRPVASSFELRGQPPRAQGDDAGRCDEYEP